MTGTPQRERPSAGDRREPESLVDLLGGRRGAVDASLPPVAFGAGWLLGGDPLWGGVVAAVLTGTAVAGQRTRWRRDPALSRAYGRGGWVWAATHALRLAVFVPLYLGGQVMALVVARWR